MDLVDDSKIVTGIQPCHLSDHDLVSFHIFDTHHVLTWGRGVWKMNTSLLKHEKLRTEIISFWSDWTEAKMLFSDVGEWWDEGKAEIKHIIIEYSKAVRQQINEQRVHLMNKFHRLSEKTNLSPHELEQLQRVRSDLCERASQRLEGAKIRSRVRIIRNNEKPSRFFFQRERYNASKKLVTALKSVNGRVTDSDGIMNLNSNKPELVRREICVSDLTSGGLKAVDIETRSKCLLIPRVFKFLEKRAAPWKDLMRYYIGRSIGVNDNSKPNCDTPSEFYGIVLRVLRELQVDVATPKSSRYFYAMAITNKVILVRPACQIKWDTNFRGLIWKDIWKRIHSWLEDPVLRDFYWRTVHLVLNVNTVLNKRNSRIPATCSRCNNRWESLAHALIHRRIMAFCFTYLQQN